MGICDHYGGLKTLQASIVSVHGPSQLYFEPLKLLTNAEADPDPAVHSNVHVDPDPAS